MDRMGAPRAAVVAWSAFGLTLAFALSTVAFGIIDHGTTLPKADGSDVQMQESIGFAGMMIAFSALGALVASRRPHNPIGWILVVSQAFLGLTQFARDWYIHTQFADPGSLPEAALLAWAANWAWVPGFVPLLTLLLLLFPDGRPPSARWRPVGWLSGLAITMLVLGYAFAPGRLEDYPRIDNPLGVGGGAGDVLELFLFLGFATLSFAAIGSMTSLAVRYRRSHGVERQQTRWMAAAAVCVVFSWLLSAFFDQVLDIDISLLILAALLTLPAATAVGVLRYRLYDLDLVVNRTLVYGALTATLAGSYLGLVLLFQAALGPLTQDSDLAIAASTLAVAALFRPLRARIQDAVDRRFYRRRYDAARTAEAFSARLRNEVELDSLSAALRGVASETMQPAHVSLWLRAREQA
jgi:hypothetical protein